jgi:FMN phosphatase YigB (HAD superfamily)
VTAGPPRLACFDLDNTLIDRDAAFAAWAEWWAESEKFRAEHTGIGAAVDFCCVSESVGARKPDPLIFKIAADRTGATLDGGWMVGDHPAYDIAGGIAAGLRTILTGSRDPQAVTPTHRFSSVLDAFPAILAG